jgi:hypothetical protein
MPGGRRHPNKDIRKVLAVARKDGWQLKFATGHRFGTLTCGRGCRVPVWTTPPNPTTHAKSIRENIARCTHYVR